MITNQTSAQVYTEVTHFGYILPYLVTIIPQIQKKCNPYFLIFLRSGHWRNFSEKLLNFPGTISRFIRLYRCNPQEAGTTIKEEPMKKMIATLLALLLALTALSVFAEDEA